MITSNDYRNGMEKLLKEGYETIKSELEKREGKLIRFLTPHFAETVLGHEIIISMIYLNDSKGIVMIRGIYDDHNRLPYEGNLRFDIINHDLIAKILTHLENN